MPCWIGRKNCLQGNCLTNVSQHGQHIIPACFGKTDLDQSGFFIQNSKQGQIVVSFHQKAKQPCFFRRKLQINAGANRRTIFHGESGNAEITSQDHHDYAGCYGDKKIGRFPGNQGRRNGYKQKKIA